MLVTLTHTDGTEQTVDASRIRIMVGEAPLDLTADDLPKRIVLQSPGDQRDWSQFVVHHSAANLMILELVTHHRPKSDPPVRKR